MGIFKKFKKPKIFVRFDSKKAKGITLIGNRQFEVYRALEDGRVYEATAYTDEHGRIVALKLKDFPKFIISAELFDIIG